MGINEAWKAAIDEGLAFYWARMHVGHEVQYVGNSWEEGGFSVDEDGNPTRDNRGNMVASYEVEELDSENPQHVKQVQEWYGE